jgi:hypothetical protein
MGLNTPRFYLVKTEEEVMDALQKLPGPNASIRTYKVGSETESVTPFHPNRPKDEARDRALSLLKEGKYSIMLSEGVGINLTEISAISKVTINHIYTEYFTGPGTVRRLTEGKITPQKIDHWFGDSIDIDERIRRAHSKMFELKCNEILFEWSYFSQPFGTLNQQLIFWEFMNDGPGAFFDGFPTDGRDIPQGWK